MKKLRAFHPPLFALHPPLALYAANVSLIPLQDTVTPILTCVAAGLLLWTVLSLAIRDVNRAASATSILLYAFFLYGSIAAAMKDWTFAPELLARESWTMLFWAAPTLLLATLAAWKWKFAVQVTVFLNVAGVAMVALATLGIIRSNVAIKNQLADAQMSLNETANKRAVTNTGESRLPDVFYIILDGYGRQDVLKKYYHFDNQSFIDALRERGLFVADNARPNYVQTELSLSSALNLDYLQILTKDPGNAADDRGVLDGMIDQSRVSAILKSRGYRLIAITTGFPALVFRHADVTFSSDSGHSLYLEALLEKTPIAPSPGTIRGMMIARYNVLNGAFANLKRLSKKSPSPRFVFAHVLAPHPPFVLGPNGELKIQRRTYGFWDGSHYMDKIGTPATYEQGYRDQVQAINRLVIGAVDALLATDGEPPIIIIQGDHGPKMRLHQDSLEKTDMSEVGGILAAYFVPEAIKAKLYPGLTPINAMRIVISAITGETFEKLPDRTYYSTWEHPLQFQDVTASLDKHLGSANSKETD